MKNVNKNWITSAALMAILTGCGPAPAPTEPTVVVVPPEPVTNPAPEAPPSKYTPPKEKTAAPVVVNAPSVLSLSLQVLDSVTGNAAEGRLGDKVLCQVNMTDGSVAAYSWSVNGEKIAGADSQALELSKTDVRFKMRPTVTCHAGDRTEAMTVVDTASVVDWGRFNCYRTNADGTRTLRARGFALESAVFGVFFDFCALSFSDVDGDQPILMPQELVSENPESIAPGYTGELNSGDILATHALCDAFTPAVTLVAGGVHVEIPGYDANYVKVGGGVCAWTVSIRTHDGAIYGTSTVDGANLAGEPVQILIKNAVGFNR